MNRVHWMRIIVSVFCVGIIARNIGSVIIPKDGPLFPPYYDESIYKHLENLYNNSQYRKKEPTSVIADEIVYRYVAGAYLRGIDPIMVNSESTPLGKYFLALSVLIFKNETVAVVFFALLTLLVLWLLAQTVFGSYVLALLPVVIFSSEKLYLNQLRVVPLLDIIQLPFILLTLLFFLREEKTGRFFLTSLFLGFVMATKSIVPAILLVLCFGLFILLFSKRKKLYWLFVWLPLSGAVLIASYLRTFLSGYNFYDFLKFQKWIFSYQESKLVYPLSVWRLLFFNQWQSWWGDKRLLSADDWRWLWPIATASPFMTMILSLNEKTKMNREITLLTVWSVVYLAFLSLGAVSTRFLLPVLPVLYIICIYILKTLIAK